MKFKNRAERWKQEFALADACKEMFDCGADCKNIAILVKRTPEAVIQLMLMAEYFPPAQRLKDIPIELYKIAVFFHDPTETVKRAWENNLSIKQLQRELIATRTRLESSGRDVPYYLSIFQK